MRLAPILGCLCVLALGGCSVDEDQRALAHRLSDCRLPHLSQAARCGSIDVPEDRGRPQGRILHIFVAVLPAHAAHPRDDPFVIVAGGPGQAASDLAAFASRFGEIRRTRDIVLVDQRGTGRSSPLACAAFEPSEDPVALLDVDPLPRARQCVNEIGARGVDLTQYTTASSVDDLEAVREALGYRKLNLWGGSYGSRVVLEYLRRHRDRVRTVVIDGAAPPDFVTPIDVWPTRERALDAILAACEGSTACSRAHPDARGMLDRLLRDLAVEPRRVRAVDPSTGSPLDLELGSDRLLAGLLPLTYSAELAALLPEIIARAHAGDVGPLLATARLFEGRAGERVNVALHFSVVCNEDAPRIRAERLYAIGDLRSASLARKTLAVCDAWPRTTSSLSTSHAVVESDVPALVLSGALDPVTPPEYGERIATALSRSRHVVASGYAHIVSPHACAPRLIAAFVADAGFDRLPDSCLRHLQSSAPPLLWPDRSMPAP